MKIRLIILLSLLAGAYCVEARNKAFDINKPAKVVCLGNSITKHEYLPAVEWYSDWGMAASGEEYDYCHQLQNTLRKYNRKSAVIPLNISYFERHPECGLDSLLCDVCENADIIVIRLGENVQDLTAFMNNIQRLIDKCRSYTGNILVTGCFWLRTDVEKTLIDAACDNGLGFIPLSWIGQRNDVYPQKGDIIYNTDKKPYIITKEFILTHPNDTGMRLIADSIFKAIINMEDC